LNLWQQIKQTTPSLIQAIKDERWVEKDVQLFIKRDDLLAPHPNDPFFGNKCRKLKHNLLFAKSMGIKTLLSFGGAYSNHIAALASAGQQLGFKTIGIIRGEKVSNPTINRAIQNGMQLYFIDRGTYRKKHEEQYLESLRQQFGPCFIIPEGGTNDLALKGATELAKEIRNQCLLPPTHIAVACGTGGTLAGITQGLSGKTQALGISVLKGNFMTNEVQRLLQNSCSKKNDNWLVKEGYHHGGYAKKTKELLTFIDRYKAQHNIQLEPIYTGKLFYALDQLLEENYFPPGSKVIGIHTGGLQGLNP